MFAKAKPRTAQAHRRFPGIHTSADSIAMKQAPIQLGQVELNPITKDHAVRVMNKVGPGISNMMTATGWQASHHLQTTHIPSNAKSRELSYLEQRARETMPSPPPSPVFTNEAKGPPIMDDAAPNHYQSSYNDGQQESLMSPSDDDDEEEEEEEEEEDEEEESYHTATGFITEDEDEDGNEYEDEDEIEEDIDEDVYEYQLYGDVDVYIDEGEGEGDEDYYTPDVPTAYDPEAVLHEVALLKRSLRIREDQNRRLRMQLARQQREAAKTIEDLSKKLASVTMTALHHPITPKHDGSIPTTSLTESDPYMSALLSVDAMIKDGERALRSGTHEEESVDNADKTLDRVLGVIKGLVKEGCDGLMEAWDVSLVEAWDISEMGLVPSLHTTYTRVPTSFAHKSNSMVYG